MLMRRNVKYVQFQDYGQQDNHVQWQINNIDIFMVATQETIVIIVIIAICDYYPADIPDIPYVPWYLTGSQ